MKLRSIGENMKKLILSLICVFLILNFISGCSNQENNEVKTISFDQDVILEHLTVNEVKLSELNTIDDFINKAKADFQSVVICYKETESEDGCPTVRYNDFLNENYDQQGISNLGFYLNIRSQKNIDNELTVLFWTTHDAYKIKKNNALYTSVDFISSNEMVMLDNKYLENITFNDMKNNYNVHGEITPYIEFKNINGDKYKYYFSIQSSGFEIMNISERDRYK